MKLKIGKRYLARDRKGKPTCFFVPKNSKDAQLFQKKMREGTITVSPA